MVERGAPEPHGARDEKPDRELDLARLIGVAFGLAGLTVAAAVVCWLLYRAFGRALAEADRPLPPLYEARRGEPPPEPRLQESPPRDMADFRARENAILNSYGWVDRQGGIARIPLDRAIELYAAGVGRPRGAAPGDVKKDGGAP